MEITVEVSGEEYKTFIKNYYLKRNWTKRIATIAIISLGLSVLGILKITNGWSLLMELFVAVFIILMILFFLIPFGVSHFRSAREIKNTVDESIKWHYKIEDKGITIDKGQIGKFLPWRKLDKVITVYDFIVFSTVSKQIFPLPLSALSVDDSKHLLTLVRDYQKKPGNKTPNPVSAYLVGLLCLIPFLGGAVGLVLIILGITSYKNKILIAIGTAGLIITGYVLNDVIQTSKQSSAYGKIDTQIMSNTAPKDYQQLLGNKIAFTETINTKLRGPISKFNYKEFHGMVYKIDSSYNSNTPLGQIMRETNNDVHITYNKTYSSIMDYKSLPEVNIIMDKPVAAKSVYFNLFGDKTQIVTKNDSIAYYFSNLKNFFIQYKQEGEQEFFGKASDKVDDDDARMPVEMMFFKRNNNLYFILLAANDLKTNLPADMLYNLVIKK
jgi:hypothetical protein